MANTKRHSVKSGSWVKSGQLMLDRNRLVHVNTRFDGEVVRIENALDAGKEIARSLRIGDRVQKGQLLTVLWSKEIGEKKSDLVDAISQLVQHEATYTNLKSLEKTGGVPQRSIDEMRRTVEADIIQVERLRRTLRSWRLDESEVVEVDVIDPNQHTTVVQGWIDNANGDLRVGQFVEALIMKSLATDLVEFSSSAVIDEGAKKYIFVALDDDLTRVQRREVLLKRRTVSTAFVSSEGSLSVQPGDRILIRGLQELSDVWNEKRSSQDQ